MAQEYNFKDILNKLTKILKIKRRKIHNEINLVPDIKNEAIKAIKFRNLVLFLCIIVASASIGVVVFFGTIVAGQNIVIDGKKTAIDELSNKLTNYKELSELLTIKDQINNIDSLTNNKKVLSRSFNVLSAIIPTGPDMIQISEIKVNLAGDTPTFSFDAQADAGTDPQIDFRVLEAFRKSTKYLTFDYGDYVDRHGAVIPAYCIIDTGEDGAVLKDSNNNYYAYWTIYGEGCDPSATEDEKGKKKSTANEYTLDTYDNQKVVRIWRTPQKEWYTGGESIEGRPAMSSDGVITNVAHFESKCINRKVVTKGTQVVKIDESDNSCMLVPLSAESTNDGEYPGIEVPDKSNGRDASGKLVLRFSAVIKFNPAIFNYNNHHVIALPPSSRRNVTDSYVQIQSIFAERAADCDPEDVTCNTTKTNGE